MKTRVLDQAVGTSALQFSESLAAAAEARPEHPTGASLQDVDVALAFDSASLDTARAAGVPCCVAVLPTFDTRWSGDLDVADGVLVAHEHLLEALPPGVRRRGVAVGALAPPGFSPSADRAAHKGKHDISATTVLVPVRLIEDLGVTPLLVQLELVSAAVTWLLDVGTDVQLARALRRALPGHSIDVGLFARADDPFIHWQLADLVLTRAQAPEVSLALGVGAGLVVLAGGAEETTVAALERTGAARISRSSSTLSIEIDGAVSIAASLAEAALRVDVAGTPQRAMAAVANQLSDARVALANGLPKGLERIRPSRTPAPARGPAPKDDFESKIDEELEALKKRL